MDFPHTTRAKNTAILFEAFVKDLDGRTYSDHALLQWCVTCGLDYESITTAFQWHLRNNPGAYQSVYEEKDG
jgi:hypothetical protein